MLQNPAATQPPPRLYSLSSFHDPQRRYSSLDAPDLVGGRRLRGTYAVTDLVAGGLWGLHRSMRLMTPKEIQIHIQLVLCQVGASFAAARGSDPY